MKASVKFVGEFKDGNPFKGTWVNTKTDKPEDTKKEYKYDKYPYGTMMFDNHTTFKGTMENGVLEGKGTEYYQYNDDKPLFQGQYKNNKRHGPGVLYHKNGIINVQCNWKNDKLEGKGVQIFDKEGKLEYEGAFKNGQPYGQGALYYKTGGVKIDAHFALGTYAGGGTIESQCYKFREDYSPIINKKIKLYYQNGNEMGELIKHEDGYTCINLLLPRDGKTKLHKSFSGQLEILSINKFVDNVNNMSYKYVNGYGTILGNDTFPKYVGEFRHMKPHGAGILTYESCIERGIFNDGQLVKGLIITKDKEVKFNLY